jgi:hypothetical protein
LNHTKSLNQDSHVDITKNETKNKSEIDAIIVDVSEIIDGDLCNTGIEEYIKNDKNYDHTKKL